MYFTILLLILLVFFSGPNKSVAQIPSSFTPIPPMGWNSWDSYGFEITEEQVKLTADFMAEHLLE